MEHWNISDAQIFASFLVVQDDTVVGAHGGCPGKLRTAEENFAFGRFDFGLVV